MDLLKQKLGNRLDDSMAILAILEIHKGLRHDKTSVNEVLKNVNEDNATMYQGAIKRLVELVSKGDGDGKVVLMVELLKADDSNLSSDERQIKAAMRKLLGRLLMKPNQFSGKDAKLNLLLMNILLECYSDVFCSKLHSQEAKRGANMASVCKDVANLLLRE